MRISDLEAKSTLLDADVLAVDNSNDSASQKIAYSTLKTLLRTALSIGTLTTGQYIQGSTVAADLTLLDTRAYTNATVIAAILADLATVQDSTTATRDFAVGSFLVMDNQLYRVDTAITSGGTIAAGTNVTAVTVAALITQAIADIADQYSSSDTYAAGDLVIYNGVLYTCSTAITTAEDWTDDHWTGTTLASLITALQTTVSTLSTETEASLASISAAENTDEDMALSQTTNNGTTTEILVFHELTASEVAAL